MKARFRSAFVLGLAVLLVIAIQPGVSAGQTPESDLKYALILTRHGVRSPLRSQTSLGPYSAEAWPDWEVAPGYLTPHGKMQMTLMGEYYRALFMHEGLLTGRAEDDAKHVYFRSDSDERTVETARGLGAALLPGLAIDPHAHANAAADPLFRPVQIPLGAVDRALAVASVLGRVGGDAHRIEVSNRAAYETLERVLVGESGAIPPGKIALLGLPAEILPGTRDHTVTVNGPLQIAASIVDVLMLEYADGMPMEKVGWGRLTPERLTQVIELHSLFFELAQASYYPARVQGSDLASHILASLEQAASGQPDRRAFGNPDQKLVVVVGHDTNIANLGGLLGLAWWLPGTHRNPVLPGGALVFELRERRADHQPVVRVYYLSQTLEQIRNLTPLSLAAPPALAPIFVPGCSGSSDRFAAPLPKFAEFVRRVVDPEFVTPDPN